MYIFGVFLTKHQGCRFLPPLKSFSLYSRVPAGRGVDGAGAVPRNVTKKAPRPSISGQEMLLTSEILAQVELYFNNFKAQVDDFQGFISAVLSLY
jgi:hypothetical protein